MAPTIEPAQADTELMAQACQRIHDQDFIIRTQQIFIAWESGELSEGQVCRALGIDRVMARELKADAIRLGAMHAGEMTETARHQTREDISNPHHELSHQDLLHAAGVVDLRDNHTIEKLPNGRIAVHPIDQNKRY
jgi:hypothetical protein